MIETGVMVRPERAKKELAKRNLARRHLVDFSEYVYPWYRAARHHRYVGELLEQVETFIRSKGATGIGRLLVFEPPRHGKTEQVSKHFPAWVLGRMPDTRVILTSYNADRANANSRAVREILTGDKYKAVFGELATVDTPVEISSDSRAVQAWDLAAPHRGGIVAAGVGGGITGAGAHLFINDDPLKNREEAESQPHRDNVWEWWTSSAYTRLEDGAAVIGMLTRWHADDWAGKLIKAMASNPEVDQYVVACLPAIWEEPEIPEGGHMEGGYAEGEHVGSPLQIDFEKFRRGKMLEGIWLEAKDALGRRTGEALWRAKYDEGDLRHIQSNIGPYDWAALYQQQPYLRSGNFFRREWFPIVEEGPKPEEVIARVRYWDKAGTRTGGTGNYCAGILMCLTKSLVYYVEHVVRGQWTPWNRDSAMLETAKIDANRTGTKTIIWHTQDPASAGLDSALATNRMFTNAGFTASFETVTGDKETNASTFSSQAQGGGVRLVRGGWNEAYIEELVAFPKGTFDDQVDASAGAYKKLSTNILDGQLFY